MKVGEGRVWWGDIGGEPKSLVVLKGDKFRAVSKKGEKIGSCGRKGDKFRVWYLKWGWR